MVEFDEVVDKIADAVRQVEADAGASPVLVAVVGEFQAKLAKATKHGPVAYLITTPWWSWSRPAIARRWPLRPTQGCRLMRRKRCSPPTWRSAS